MEGTRGRDTPLDGYSRRMQALQNHILASSMLKAVAAAPSAA